MADVNCPVTKIDSNVTGLAFAEEVCPGQLPDAPVWRALEPNSYSDFGGEVTTTTRAPINASRQNQRGIVTDLEASGGFNQDLTLANTTRLLQGFFFANIRQKATNSPMNGNGTLITAVAADTGFAIAGADTRGFKAGHLILGKGFESANNKLMRVTAVSATAVAADGAVADATPTQWASIKAVGFEFGAGTVAMQAPAGAYPRLVATGFDLTTLGLLAGEWVFIGGDAAASRFATTNGFARIKSVNATTMIFDKISWANVADAGTGKTIRIFFGDVLRNEKNPDLIVTKSLQLRRTLGKDESGTQSEYLVGAIANELTINVPLSEKMTVDFGYVAMDAEQRTGAEGLKPGTEVAVESDDVFNTSSDFARIKLGLVDPTNGNVSPLFGFATEMSLTIGNGVTMNKALGVFGAMGQSTGNFEVGGSITAYFSTVAAVRAVRNNADVTLDIIAVKKNKGMIWDIPQMTLGGGRVTIEANNPIMIPLENNASESSFGHTLQFQRFDYLPNLAQ